MNIEVRQILPIYPFLYLIGAWTLSLAALLSKSPVCVHCSEKQAWEFSVLGV